MNQSMCGDALHFVCTNKKCAKLKSCGACRKEKLSFHLIVSDLSDMTRELNESYSVDTMANIIWEYITTLPYPKEQSRKRKKIENSQRKVKKRKK